MLPARLARRLYYGWIIVAVCSLVLVVAFGVRLSFSVFFVALIADFGWSRADTALIYSLSMVIFTAGSTFTGLALDRLGVRLMFALGAALMALGLLLASRVETFPQLVLRYGVLVGLGVTVLGLGQQAAVIARWFRARLGLAIGLAFAGTGLGSLLIIPGASWVIERYGWRAAWQGLALLAALLIPLVVLFLRLNPRQLGLAPEGDRPPPRDSARPPRPARRWTMRQAARTPAFWLLLLAGLTTIGPVRLLTVHQLAAMTDAGFALQDGARVVGVAGATTALTFIVSGALSDRFGRITTYLIGALCLLAAFATIGTLTPSRPPAVLWLYAVLYGIGEGTRSSLVTAVASDLFPGDALGAINGAVGSMFGAGAAFYPWLAGRLYDLTGSYRAPFTVAALTVLLSVAALWLAARRPHRSDG